MRTLVIDSDLDYPVLVSSKTARRIADIVNNDSDALSSKSRHKDRALLDNLNKTIGYSTFAQPATVRSSPYRVTRRNVSITPPPSPVTIRSSGAATTSARPTASSARRPPVYQSTAYVATPRIVPPLPHVYHDDFLLLKRGLPRSDRTPFSSVPFSRSASEPPRRDMTPSANLAVREARRHLFRLEKELGMTNDFDAYYVPDELSVPRGRTYVRRELPAKRFASVPASPVVPSRPYMTTYEYDLSGDLPLRRFSSVPSIPYLRNAPHRRAYRYREFEDVLDDLSYPRRRTTATTVGGYYPAKRATYYPSLTTDDIIVGPALTKTAGGHKDLLARYLPLHLRQTYTAPAITDYEFTPLSSLSPSSSTALVAYRPVKIRAPMVVSNVTNDHKRPPLPPGVAPNMPRSSGRPPVSETRKKFRDLLCKTKRDPRYYDFN